MPPSADKAVSRHVKDEFAHKVLNASLNGIYIYDLNLGRNVYVNQQYTVLTGYSLEDIRAMDKEQFTGLFHPDDRQRIFDHLSILSQNETPALEIQYRFRTRDGRWIWCLSRNTVFGADEDGGVVQIIGTFLDVTDKRKIEKQQRHQRELMQLIFDNIPVLLIIWDPQLKRFTLNRHAENLLGWSTEEANKIDFMRAVYPDEAYRKKVAGFMRSLEPHWHEWRVATRDGDSIPIDWTNIRLADHSMIGIGVDLRARKMAEQSLKESEARFQTMADGLPLLVWVHDTDGRLLFANRTFREFFGIPVEEMAGHHWQNFIHPDDARTYIDVFLSSVREQRPFRGQARVRRPDGQWRWLQSWGSPRFSPQGSYLGYVGASADVTDRKEAENILKRSKEELEEAVRMRTSEIEAKNERLKQMNQVVRQMARLNIKAMEHDRKALSKEIHDSIGGSLSAIKMLLETRLHEFGQPPPEGLTSFEDIIRHLSETIKESKRISFQMRSLALDDFGLKAAVYEAVKKFNQYYPHISVEEEIGIETHEFSDEINTVVYRIIQEALNNIGKHSGAATARIELHSRQDRIHLMIQDDGCGFDTASVYPLQEQVIHGFGIQSMKERAEICGGTFYLISAPGEGTRIKVSIPTRIDEGQFISPGPEYRSE